MKFLKLFSLTLMAVLLSDMGFGYDLLSVSTENLSQIQAKSRFESLLIALARFDQAWTHHKPHQAEEILNSTLAPCEAWLSDVSPTKDHLEKVREGYLCLILEGERINRLSPVKVIAASERIKKLSEALQVGSIPAKEKLYAEGRIYSSLPALYGGDLKRAILALETLRRLESNPKVSIPWIHRIRQMQGKKMEEINELSEPAYKRRQETDGLPVSIMAVLYGGFPQGIGIQVKGQDYALFDTERKIQGRVFATHRGSIGGELKFEDYESFDPFKLMVQLNYLHGIQEYHGLGLSSPKESMDLYMDRGTADVAIQKVLWDDLYLKVGWRFHSSHLREAVGGNVEADLEGISNAFDMGLLSELGYDSRDSETEPYRGQRYFLQNYLPRKSLGSSRNFERWLAVAENYWLLSLQTQLKLHGAFVTVSDTAPFSWYSQLSGTLPFSGVRPTRFVDRALTSLGVELRWKKASPVTLLTYINAAFMGPSARRLFEMPMKWGGGVGGEIHLTRFRSRAFRIEVGNFGGEWNFNSMIGIAID